MQVADQPSDERFRLLVENSADMISRHDVAGRFLDVSAAAKSLVGFEQAELLGRRLEELVHPDDVAAVREVLEAFPAGQTRRLAFRLRTSSGQYVWLEAVAKTIAGGEAGDQREIVIVVRDLTPRKLVEEERHQLCVDMARAERVSSVRKVTSTLVHKINQPLASITNYSQACVRYLQTPNPPREELLEAMQSVAAEAVRASEMVRHFRHLPTRDESRRSMVSLNQVVREVADYELTEIERQEVGLRLQLADALPEVRIDRTAIQQVLIHLIRNALEAMADVPVQKRMLTIETSGAPDALRVRVSDTGPLVPLATLTKMFEPYFTTKPYGLGLGLSVSRSLIEGHGGRIWAEPHGGQGTSVRFTLPI